MTMMADEEAQHDASLAALARCLDTAVPARSGKARPWLCAAISCALHSLAVIGLVWAGLLDLSQNLPVAEPVVEIDLAGLAGPAGAGGDGRLPGGGDGLPVAGRVAGPVLPMVAQAADMGSAAETMPPDAAPVLEEKPLASPETVLLPDPEAPKSPELRPQPQPQPPPKPKPQAKPPVQPPAKALRPQDKPTTAKTVASAAVAGPSVAEASPGPSGTGPAGPGEGHGSGHGPGHGGLSGDGPGGGGGGDFVGQFGQGDGPCFRRRSLPSYPSEAKRANLEGKVSLRLFIDAAGGLRNVEVLEHSGLEFAEEAVKAVRASSFSPAKRGGQTVASRATLTIRFRIN
ncbi:energy transducer TonB [Solidesulfovibrio magneticus]|uniref:TonB protein n=1 Tax=Solidesulfovibrio magneticus (strain ATCC 700980 / DSM 13731 / RS-1) TaxID=573370 RepID=C4XGU8_SOLM1|nr:energy transducer TonB [Solidesulfovibrio magneticus]BAH76253.1 putative TonB protein [Solidesulfovibrio magneticus RS-1]